MKIINLKLRGCMNNQIIKWYNDKLILQFDVQYLTK